MKLLCLLLCYISIAVLGSVSVAAATPIGDTKDGGIVFDDTGGPHGNGHFPGEPPAGCPTCLPGQPGSGKYRIGSAVSPFEIEKDVRESKNETRHDEMEEGREVTNPAPATLFLLGTGLIGLAAFRRKRPVKYEKTIDDVN